MGKPCKRQQIETEGSAARTSQVRDSTVFNRVAIHVWRSTFVNGPASLTTRSAKFGELTLSP